MIERKKLLITKRLRLHSIEEDSRDQMMAILYNDRIKKTYMIPDFKTEADAEKMFQRFVTLSSDPNRYVYGVFFENRLIGFFNDVSKENCEIEMGYVIYPDFHNRGFATEAFSAIIEELFRVGFTTVKAGYFCENDASRRVMEKCGLKETEKHEDIEYRGTVHHCNYMEIKKQV